MQGSTRQRLSALNGVVKREEMQQHCASPQHARVTYTAKEAHCAVRARETIFLICVLSDSRRLPAFRSGRFEMNRQPKL